jgi:hypothetical protein
MTIDFIVSVVVWSVVAFVVIAGILLPALALFFPTDRDGDE